MSHNMREMSKFCHERTQMLTEQSIATLKKKEELAKKFFDEISTSYKTEQLMICFNGGKDCTVLLDLLHKYHKAKSKPIPAAVYIQSANAFDEVNEFVNTCTVHYGLELRKYIGGMKSALERLHAELPQVRGMFLGNRRSDPRCGHYHTKEPTDEDWPSFMRLFPLLDWSYRDVWNYIRYYDVPYCKLYDEGYTSLGDKTNTTVNSELLCFNKETQSYMYRPAYELSDINLERTNREQQKIAALSNSTLS